MLKIAFVLPPVQSFFNPYSAPSILSGWLDQERKDAVSTLVIDSGLEWLISSEHSNTYLSDAIGLFRLPSSWSSTKSIVQAYRHLDSVLGLLCEGEDISIHPSGRLTVPNFNSWNHIHNHLLTSSLFDEVIRDIVLGKIITYGADMVVISVPFQWMLLPALRLSRFVKELIPSALISLGGHAVTGLSNNPNFRQISMADNIDIGAGELSILSLVDSLLSGLDAKQSVLALEECNTRFESSSVRMSSPLNSVVPDYRDLELPLYLSPSPILPVLVSDGCYFGRCRFCSRQKSNYNVSFQEARPFPIFQVMCELEARHGARQFILAGDIISHSLLHQISEIIHSSHKSFEWFAETTLKGSHSGSISAEFAHKLRAGGCRILLNGLESGSSRVRDLMGCDVDIEKYKHDIRNLSNAGIIPYITLIHGFPGESILDLMETVAWVDEFYPLAVHAISEFSVVRGTKLEEELLLSVPERLGEISLLAAERSFSNWEADLAIEARSILTQSLKPILSKESMFVRSIPVLMQLLDLAVMHAEK